MTSTCSAGSWKQGLPTWRTSCGRSTSPDAPGHYSNRPRLLPTPWRGTPLTWWSWPRGSRWCWSSSATRLSTAMSTRFWSTTLVSEARGFSWWDAAVVMRPLHYTVRSNHKLFYSSFLSDSTLSLKALNTSQLQGAKQHIQNSVDVYLIKAATSSQLAVSHISREAKF